MSAGRYDIDDLFDKINAVWGTRDSCLDHYPHYCPEGCPGAGIHNESLGALCECRACREALK